MDAEPQAVRCRQAGAVPGRSVYTACAKLSTPPAVRVQALQVSEMAAKTL